MIGILALGINDLGLGSKIGIWDLGPIFVGSRIRDLCSGTRMRDLGSRMRYLCLKTKCQGSGI